MYFCPFGCQSDHQCDRVPHQLCHRDGDGDSREPTSIIRYERVTCRQGCEDLAQFKTDKDDRSDHHNSAEQACAEFVHADIMVVDLDAANIDWIA